MTGREIIINTLLNTGATRATAYQVAERIYASGYVCVPRKPTPEMITNAWAWEIAEDAAGVWMSMINTSEGVTVLEILERKD